MSKIRPILKLNLLTNLLRAGEKTLTGCLLIASFGDCALAQITVDNSLGSVVTPNANNTELQITGGVLRGGNRFHSFQDFNVQAGQGAFFIQGPEINILGRITGGNSSQILGTLGVRNLNGGVGNANLFLINPNGITFGPGASLQLGGSFVATTANAIGFGNLEDTFNASDLSVPSVRLAIDPTVFIFNQLVAQPITNQSQFTELSAQGTPLKIGLRSGDGRSLVLLGGDIILNNGGALTAAGGRVELGGLAGSGTVGFNLNPDRNVLSLSFPSGVTRADVILQNQALVNAAAPSNTDILTGEIFIQARSIRLENQSQLSSSTFDARDAGNIFLQADSDVRVETNSAIFNQQVQNDSGNAGNILINAGSFFLNNSRLITDNNGTGVAGNINITARDQVSVIGGSQISSESNTNDQGAGFGSIQIQATQGSVALENSRINTTNSGIGFAGDILITARDQVSISGGLLIPSDTDGEVKAITSQGNRGRIWIGEANEEYPEFNYSPRNILIDGANVSTTNLAYATDAGDIFINADNSLILTNRSIIESNTQNAGNAGNITIYTNAFLLMRRNSQINTNAESGSRNSGGNITITTGALAAFPNENSDITADSNNGRGGFIEINARGILGFEVRQRNTSRSEVRAISQLSPELNGVVAIFTDVDLSSELGRLPEIPVDFSGLIAQSCQTVGDKTPSRFRRRGNPGNLQPNPVEELDNKPTSGQGNTSRQGMITEAQGWVRDPNNREVLHFVAQPPTSISFNSEALPAICNEP